MLRQMAHLMRRWRLVAVLALASVLFCGVVSKDVHGHDAVHHGLSHYHGHPHGDDHAHHDEAGEDVADRASGPAGRSGDVTGHAHFDIFLLAVVLFPKQFGTQRLESVVIADPPRSWRWHFDRPPKI